MALENDALVNKLQTETARLKDENQKHKANTRGWMRIAGTDSLTGLPNKVYFTTALLPQAISHANEENEHLGCVMLAPDNLGEINKKFGRSGGDDIAKETVGQLLTRLEAALDQPKQLGGDRLYDDPEVNF